MTPRYKLKFLRQKTYIDVRFLNDERKTDNDVIQSLLTRCALFQMFLEDQVRLEEFQEWANNMIITDNIELEKQG